MGGLSLPHWVRHAHGNFDRRHCALYDARHSTANRVEVLAAAGDPNDVALARHLHAYLRWRNAHARYPDVLAVQPRQPAKIRSERQRRGGRPVTGAA